MAVWEYKVISSGKGGFATPALLESFLNQLGKEQWDILEYHSLPDNPLAFSGLARRSTQRDWTLEDAASAAAKVEAEKLRAEFEAKFKGAGSGGGSADEKQESPAAAASEDDGYRKIRDTDRDQDPESPDEPEEEWDKLSSEEELPSFFDAMKPHMRRNQRGPGMSVGVDFLAKKWDLHEDDVLGALRECGFDVPADEDVKPVYIEYDGDLYWVNINRRGELWVNTKEKPRQVFKVVQGTRVAGPEEPTKTENTEAPQGEPPAEGRHESRNESRKQQQRERERDREQEQAPGAPLPEGEALLAKIHPQMRRNRRGPGSSGSTSFLSRALRCKEADIMTAFTALGLTLGPDANEKPAFVEIGERLWWLNRDQRGGVWINERHKKDQEVPAEGGSASDGGAPVPTSDAAIDASAPEGAAAAAAPIPDAVLAGVRLLLKKTRTGGFAAKVETIATELSKTPEDLVATLVNSGLRVPEKAKDKPVFVEHAGEIFWFNLSPKDELWVNAKASKYADDDRKGRRPAKGKKKDDAAGETPSEETPAAAVNEAPSETPAVSEPPTSPQSEDPAPPPASEESPKPPSEPIAGA